MPLQLGADLKKALDAKGPERRPPSDQPLVRINLDTALDPARRTDPSLITPAVRDQLARIDCPTLVCVGALDPITPVAAAREIVDALPDGSVQFEVIDGAGHFPWKDVPDRYWPLITEFVATATVTRVGSKPMASG